MALTFPSNPTLNQVYSTGSLSWTWNGKSWNNGTSILATSNLVSSSVQFTNGNTTAFDTNSNITVGQITASFAKISGSIFGTASFATNAFSASYAPNIYVLPSNVVSSSAQHANGGGVAFDTNTNITVGQITASFAKITNLTVEYVTSSVMVITGSNKFGDASNDKQEFTGSVSISGSLSIVGNVTSNNVLSLASGTVALPSLILSTDTTSGMYRIGANNIGISISAAKVLDISSTGLSVTGTLSASGGYNGTVGAGTPSTVAATTISASNTVSQDFNGAGGNSFTARYNSSNPRGGVYVQGGSGKVFFGENLVHSTANVFVADKAGTAWALADSGGSNVGLFYATGLTAGATAFDFSTTTGRILSVTSTGLAVTGALSASGVASFLGLKAQKATATSGFISAIDEGANVYNVLGSRNNADNAYLPMVIRGTTVTLGATSDIATISSTGLAVTGALSATSTITGTGITASTGLRASGAIPSNLTSNSVYDFFANTSRFFSFGDVSTEGQYLWYTGLGAASPTQRMGLTSTGLAVTGALSATGNISTTGGDVLIRGSAGGQITQNSGAGGLYITNTGTSTSMRLLVTNGAAASVTALTLAADTGAATFASNVSVTGQIAVGGSTIAASIRSTFTGNTIDGISLLDSADQSNTDFAVFRKANSTAIGSIRRVTTTDAVAYNTTSDGRLKENLRDFTDSGRLIDSLKPRVFDWKNSDENGKNVIGFIAQEEHAADPIFAHIGAVSVGDEDSETITKQWQRSDSALIPILVAELKALRQRVAALEAK